MDHPQIPNLRLGTSSWSSQDWVGVFYPAGTASADFISEYAKHFDTVEVDSTFYRTPSAAMVRNWRARTPSGFLAAAKFPQVITHEKVLVDCANELSEFLKAMDLLGDKLGPLLLQFPYFNKQALGCSSAAFVSWDSSTIITPGLRPAPSSFSTEYGSGWELRTSRVSEGLLSLPFRVASNS